MARSRHFCLDLRTYYCLTVISLYFACAVEEGKVDVGFGDTDIAYSDSFNENYRTALFFPVYMYVIETDTGAVVPDFGPTEVEISCDALVKDFGYSQITVVSDEFVISSPTTEFLNFTIVTYGRPAEIFCSGNSVGGEFLFNATSSEGQRGFIEIRKAGFVSVCKSQVDVEKQVSTNQTFIVELSEPVEIGPVSVNCVRSTPGVGLTLYSIMMTSGVQRAQVPFQYTSAGDPVTVTCTAQTTSTQDNRQFYLRNSTGDSATFSVATGLVELRPNNLYVRGTNFTSLLILLPYPLAGYQVTFGCVLKESNLAEQAQVDLESNDCGNADISSVWSLRESTFTLTGDIFFAQIEANRANNTQEIWPELVVVTCCQGGTSNEDPKYIGQNVSLLAQVNFPGGLEYSLEIDGAQTYPEPWYVNLAPCPCDVVEDACDPDCCCDAMCDTEADVAACFQGYYGGQTPPVSLQDCSSTNPQTSGAWDFLCIQGGRNSLLGLYRDVPDLLLSADIGSVYDTFKPNYTYQQQPFVTEEGDQLTGYDEGRNLKTARDLEQGTDTLIFGSNYRLVLPGPVTAGHCEFSSPVRFLQGTDNSCEWRMSESLCASRSPLNALNYAKHSRGVGDQTCRKGLVVLASQRIAEVAETNVNYLCATDLTQYLISDYNTVSRTYPSASVNVTDCGFDQVSGAYICSENTQTAPSMEIPRCTFDDSYNDPPAPVYNPATGECQNAVVSVQYNFIWKGENITYLNATVVLGDIPVTQVITENVTVTYWDGSAVQETVVSTSQSYAVRLIQPIKVDFRHSFNTSLYESLDPDVQRPYSSEKYERSGKRGYLDGLRIRTGVEVTDASLASQVDEAYNISMWAPSLSCVDASLVNVMFNRDAYSGCALYLEQSDFADCDNLRQFALYQQDRLTRASLIGIGGDPNPGDLTEWRTIMRENISDSLTSTTDNNTITLDRCDNVVSGVHVDIFYTDTGEASGAQTLSIASARIRYILSNWTFLGQSIQLYELTASVTFTRIPSAFSTDPLTLSEYVEQQRTSGVEVCRYDACWRERLLYPWTSHYGSQLAWSAVLLLTLSGVYLVTSHGQTYIRLLKLGAIYFILAIMLIGTIADS